jgi:RNA polymerase sigma-70 factor, ECF subfamily
VTDRDPQDHDDDLELVERMLTGDEAAFETFGATYPKALYRFALGRLRGDRERTREVVQTAVCKALSRLETYRGEASLLTWLCACCRNEILMHLRRLSTHPTLVQLTELTEAEGAAAPAVGFLSSGPANDAARDPEAALLRREAADRVHVALDALPEHYSRALEWKYLERLPVAEIATRLDLKPKAAESLLTRARSAFRQGYESLRLERDLFVAGRHAEGNRP